MSPRKNYGDGQELIFEDLDAETSVLENEIYDRVIHQMLQKVDNGFFGDSFLVNFVGATLVSVAAGLGMQLDNTQVDPEPLHRLVYQATSTDLTLMTPDSVHDRIDLIVVKSDRQTTATATRNYKDPISLVISPQSFITETDWDCDLLIVTGTPGISPVAPSVPSGYLKLAQCYVHAVSGLASQSDITDGRALLPIAGDSLINTTLFNRAPVGAAIPLSQVLAAFDAYLKQGYQNYTDYDDLGSDPAAPGSSKQRLYVKGGVAFLRAPGGSIVPLGSGGGGGGGANWNGAPGVSPLSDSENGELIWLYDVVDRGTQKLTLFVKVPQGYISGRQILMYIGEYSPSTTGTQLLKSVTSLIRHDVDAAGSTANQRTSTNTALTNTVANRYRQVALDLTDAVGKINSFSVSPGDLLRVDLVRDSSDTDTNDVRFIPSATEVKFS